MTALAIVITIVVMFARKRVLTIRLSDEERQLLDVIVRRRKRPASEIIREWIRDEFTVPTEHLVPRKAAS